MTPHDDITDDLEPGTDPREAEALSRVARRLTDERPVPRPAFRGALWRHLSARDAPAARRPQQVGGLIAAFAASGFLLLAIAALGLAGTGPFAA